MIPAEIASRLGMAELEAKQCKSHRDALLQEVARLLIAMQWIVERCDKGDAADLPRIRVAASAALLHTGQPVDLNAVHGEYEKAEAYRRGKLGDY